MEHSVKYTLTDGTEYEVKYDDQTPAPFEAASPQMHYLVFENGALKLETWHHALPGGLTEEEFRSVIVIGAFFSCMQRGLNEYDRIAEMRTSDNPAMVQLAGLITPHMRLRDEHIEWAKSIIERQHDVELAVKIMQDAEVERFSRQLETAAETNEAALSRLGEEDEEDYVRPAVSKVRQFWLTYYPAIIWSLLVVFGVGIYMLVV